MRKAIALIFYLLIFIPTSYAQESRSEFTDRFLASNFKAFFSVDSELGYCMGPIIEERLVAELTDSNSFYYPYDSLSNYIRIESSEDRLLRTFSWDRRSGGTWHDMASYAQFKTQSGKVNWLKLYTGDEGGDGEPTDVVIYEVYTIYINGKSHYLMLGWGTHGGGQHHSLARVYKIEGENLILCDSIFDGQKYLVVGANRGSKIELRYDPESKTISHYSYEFDGDIGFYKQEAKLLKWKLKGDVFVKK